MFEINQKKIRYTDRKWPKGINFIPKDEGFVRQVIMSRNKIAPIMIKWINDANTGKDYEEWLACKDDYEVAEVVKKDAKFRGCVFREMFNDEQLKQQEIDNQSALQVVAAQEQVQVQTDEQVQENEQVQTDEQVQGDEQNGQTS